jgi:hypothetical protein
LVPASIRYDTRSAFSFISLKIKKIPSPTLVPVKEKQLNFLSFFLFSPLPCTLTLEIEKEKEKERKKPATASPSNFAKESGKNCSNKKKKRSAKPIPSHQDLEWSCLELHLRFSIASQFV